MASHLASLWKGDFLELGNGLLCYFRGIGFVLHYPAME